MDSIGLRETDLTGIASAQAVIASREEVDQLLLLEQDFGAVEFGEFTYYANAQAGFSNGFSGVLHDRIGFASITLV